MKEDEKQKKKEKITKAKLKLKEMKEKDAKIKELEKQLEEEKKQKEIEKQKRIEFENSLKFEPNPKNKTNWPEKPSILLHQNPFFEQLKESKSVLLCGCGGGYDFFGAIPLYLSLRNSGKKVFLSNLTFSSNIQKMSGKRFPEKGNWCVEINSDSGYENDVTSQYYFPERLVSKWFKENENIDVPIYTLVRSSGPKKHRESYECIINEHQIDAIVLVDNGTDSLMFGDEPLLGSPQEDMTSIAAIYGIKTEIKKILVNIGFGVDSFHGVNHYRYLENVSTIIKQGGFFGAFSLLRETEEAQKMNKIYLACQPYNSIVCSSVTSAVNGDFGDFHHKSTQNRTYGSELFINPIMSLYWCFDLDIAASNIIYLQEIMNCENIYELDDIIRISRSKYFKDGEYIGERFNKKIPH
eukprot:gene8005-12470_t